MRPVARPAPFSALALVFMLGACGGSAGQGNGSALASLDTRLTNGAATTNLSTDANLAADNAAAPVETARTEPPQGPTLGALAQQQAAAKNRAPARLAAAAGRKVGGCAGRDLVYGEQWAGEMPAGLALYPGAHLVEAAGSDTGRCALRVMTFTTTDDPATVASHYAARARAAGFDAERQPCKDEIRLGGVRGDAAYMLFARRTARGLTEVDIVARADPAA